MLLHADWLRPGAARPLGFSRHLTDDGVQLTNEQVSKRETEMVSASNPEDSSDGTHHPWDRFLTSADRAVFAQSGYGARQGFHSRPCLLVVDVTVGFVGNNAVPAVESNRMWPDSCGESGWNAVPYIKRLLDAARQAEVPVVYTTGMEPTPDGIGSGRWADKNSRWGEPGRRAGANKIVPDIAPVNDELVIRKPKPSAFFASALLSYLIDLDIGQLIVCGTTTSGCVRATVVDAFSLNYPVSVVEEATFDRGEVSHAISLFDMDLKYADVVKADAATDYLVSAAEGKSK